MMVAKKGVQFMVVAKKDVQFYSFLHFWGVSYNIVGAMGDGKFVPWSGNLLLLMGFNGTYQYLSKSKCNDKDKKQVGAELCQAKEKLGLVN